MGELYDWYTNPTYPESPETTAVEALLADPSASEQDLWYLAK